MLIDRFMPVFHFNEVHTIAIDAEPGRIYRAIKELRAGEIPLFRELMAVRSLPAMLLGRVRPRRGYDRPLLDEVLKSGTFILLADEPGCEIVTGSVGKFWQISGGMLRLSGPDEFLSEAHAGYARTALSFRIGRDKRGGGPRLRTETRILVPDLAARRRFGAYWLLIKPGSAFIRRMWLLAIKRRAESNRPS
ncbi:MAG: hypothetical protein WCD37_06880 [Chloroflexia bacterium]